MKVQLGIVAAVFVSCAQNRGELQRVLAESRQMLEADTQRIKALTEKPRLSIFEMSSDVDEAIAAKPELKAEIDAIPLGEPTPSPALPTPPKEAPNEGDEGAKLRAEIATTQAEARRVHELLTDLESVDLQRRRLEAALKLINERRAK